MVKGRSRVAISYAVTSLPATATEARGLLNLSRGHWGIENRLHWVRDVTFDEDRSQIRIGAASQVMAAFRNLVITLVRWVGHLNIAAALRRPPRGNPRLVGHYLSHRKMKRPWGTAAAIDQVVHHSVILEFDVPSYRTGAAQRRGQEQEVNRQN